MTSHNFSLSQTVRKPVFSSRGGVVAAQHRKAAEVGAAVLEAGGDAIDAAVATSFAIGVIEPWMSGPVGGGAMQVWREKEQKATTVFFGMRSPKALKVSDYPLEGSGRSSDLFPWPAVLEDRNVRGATAVAVPGTVAGMALAHETFGKMPWKDLLSPAAALASAGLQVDWYASLIIASAARELAKDPDAAKLFLDDGIWPKIAGWTANADMRLDQSRLAATLTRLAEAGAKDFYTGDIARELVKDVQAKGGSLGLEDLAAYSARFADPLSVAYRGATIHATAGLTAGPNLVDCLAMMEEAFTPGAAPDATSYAAMVDALGKAYKKRLSSQGDNPGAESKAPSCTTHFSVVDRHGNMVAVTQTLLSLFGSKVVSPSTGFLLNNGIMWFDPEQNKPNSLAPDKGCLMNICPTIGEKKGRRFAIGASGGRKILPAVLNLTSFLTDFDLSLEEAFHQPRVDNSGGGTVIADETLPRDVLAAIQNVAPTITTKRNTFPYSFACPSGVLRENGMNQGCTEIMSPWGDAVAEKL